MPIYLHQRKNGKDQRLIMADNKAQAMKYVMQNEYVCEPAKVTTVVEMMQKGILVENASGQKTQDMFSSNGGEYPSYKEAGGE